MVQEPNHARGTLWTCVATRQGIRLVGVNDLGAPRRQPASSLFAKAGTYVLVSKPSARRNLRRQQTPKPQATFSKNHGIDPPSEQRPRPSRSSNSSRIVGFLFPLVVKPAIQGSASLVGRESEGRQLPAARRRGLGRSHCIKCNPNSSHLPSHAKFIAAGSGATGPLDIRRMESTAGTCDRGEAARRSEEPRP